MVKKIAFVIHSFVDVITNSSSELYVVNTENITSFAEELFELFRETFSEGYTSHETTITKFNDYNYKDEYIIPEEINPDNLYLISVDYDDPITEKLINKYFKVIQLEIKEDY